MTNTTASAVPDTQLSSTARTAWRELGVHNFIKILIIGGLLYYLFRGEIANVVRKWQTDGSWSHGFIIPLFSLYFINQRKREILNLRSKPSYLGLFLLLCVLAFYLLNLVHLRYGYFRPLTVIAALGAVVLFLGGWRLVRYTWLPITFLVFSVPLPHRIYRGLTIPMRRWAASVASALLNLVPELETTANGVVIDVVYKGAHMEPGLDVAEACSGMRLLMAFLALGVAMAYLHYRPIWQRLVLLATTIPIAIFCNIIRVTTTGFIYILWDPKYATGIYHDLLGIVMLPLAFALYGVLAWFMSSLFIDEADEPKEDVVVRNSNRHT